MALEILRTLDDVLTSPAVAALGAWGLVSAAQDASGMLALPVQEPAWKPPFHAIKASTAQTALNWPASAFVTALSPLRSWPLNPTAEPSLPGGTGEGLAELSP